jgi:hypothetical protein
MTHTVESIQNWIDNYNFTTNANASKDIMEHIVRELPSHSYKFGPVKSGNYVLEINGDIINETFTINMTT